MLLNLGHFEPFLYYPADNIYLPPPLVSHLYPSGLLYLI
jgi:hypothetical protein